MNNYVNAVILWSSA